MIAGYSDLKMKAEERHWNMCTDTERQQEDKNWKSAAVWRRKGSRKRVRDGKKRWRRCKMWRCNTNAFTLQFLTIELHFAHKGRSRPVKIATFPQRLTIEPHFLHKGCAGQLKIAIFPQFLTIEPHFVRDCRVFVIARGHRPRLKREEKLADERREREEKEKRKRRERERERGRDEDVMFGYAY